MTNRQEDVLNQVPSPIKIQAFKDALDVINGKWKVPILLSLCFEKKRFKEISRDLKGITDRMLAKELRELEVNQMVKRTVYESFPPVVEYEITKHGETLKSVLEAMSEWGILHRKKIVEK